MSVNNETESTIAKFRELEQWVFNSYANTSSTFLMALLKDPVVPALEKGIIVGIFWRKRRSFLGTLLDNTLSLHVQSNVVVVLGLMVLLAGFLLFSVALIKSYRRKQKRLTTDGGTLCISSYIRLRVAFAIFMICCLPALACCLILGISAVRGYYTLVVPFKFAEGCWKSALQLSDLLQPMFENYLREMSQHTFESSLKLYKIDEEVGEKLLKWIYNMANPVFEIAGTLTHHMTRALGELSLYRDELPQNFNRTVGVLNRLSTKYVEAVKTIRKSVDIPALEPTTRFPKFEVSSEAVKTLDGPIALYRNVSRINVQRGFRDMFNQLEDVAYREYFDVSDLVSEVRQLAFEVENKVRPMVEKYLAFVKTGFQNDRQAGLLDQIAELESEAMSSAFPIFCTLLTISVIAVVFIVFVLVVYIFAFRSANSKPPGKPLWGRLLLRFSYANCFLLLLMWVLGIVLFLFSVLSMEACVSVRDKSIFDVSLDDKVFHEKTHWFNMFSSSEFNMTLKETLSNCSTTIAYAPFIPDDLPQNDNNRLVALVNFTSVAALLREQMQNLTGYNSSMNTTPQNMTLPLDEVDLRPPFVTLRSILDNVTRLDAGKVLERVAKKNKDPDVLKQIDDAAQIFEDIESHLEKAVMVEKDFNESMTSVRISVLTYEKLLEDVRKTSDGLHADIVSGSPLIYQGRLQSVVAEKVDKILFEMRLAISQFRREAAFCQDITRFYRLSTTVFCNILLFPVLTACNMAFLISFLLAIMIVASVLPMHFFLKEASLNGKPAADTYGQSPNWLEYDGPANEPKETELDKDSTS